MPGHTSWKEIKERADPEVRRLGEEQARVMLAKMGMSLGELRRHVGLTQEEVASRMGNKQTHVSRLERRNNVRVSKLRKYVRALGGRLRIFAEFPERTVRIGQFDRDEE